MTTSVRDLASFLGGEIIGDPDVEIHGAAGVRDVGEGEITFLTDRRLTETCARSTASCVVVKEHVPELAKTQILVRNPLYAFARLLEYFYVREPRPTGVSDLASVSPTASVGKDVSIHPFAYIADDAVVGDRTVIFPGVFIGTGTRIGSGCILSPGVTIREGVTMGDRVIVHAGSVIGADGFGYVFENGRHHKIPQVGGVVIGDDVEIGANVTIDRATTGNTVIGSGTKIDNLVQIAHNVTIGDHSIIVAQVAVGGSTQIGNFVVLGGQVGVADHARIDDGCMVGAQSGVMGHLAKGVYSGSPCIPHRDWLKASALFARLPELARKTRELEERIKELEGRRND